MEDCMDKWLGLDSKFYKWGTFVADMLILMILWAVCSLPVITIGASTTAVYYVTTRMLSNREGYIAKDFFKSFFSNFIKATLVTVLIGVMLVVEYINIMAMDKSSLLFPVQFFIVFEIVAFALFVFPLLSRFNMKFFELLRNAFFMANRHLLTSISCIIMIGAVVFLLNVLTAPFYVYPIVLMLAFAIYATVTSMMFMNIFRKYVPEMDVDDNDPDYFNIDDSEESTDKPDTEA
jgi:uncharacterized membrane protein YesL